MHASRRAFIIQAGRATIGLGAVAVLAACGSAAPASSAPASSAAPASPSAAAASSSASASAAVAASPSAATTSASASAFVAPPAMAGEINFYIGGDVNIRDIWNNDLLPLYKKSNPNARVNVVFDEHALSADAVYTKLAAAKQAGKPSGVDLWEDNSGRLQTGGEASVIQKLTTADIPNLAKVPADALARFGSFGAPYRASSVILAYNSKMVKDPPKTLDALISWAKANDGLFTYNPPDKGGSGGNFVQRVLSMDIKPADTQFFITNYDQAKENEWDQGWQVLKDLGPHIFQKGFYPQGNIPVLQTLGKESIAMAPVWSDQSLSYLSQKLLPDTVKLIQIDPPFAGSAAYLGMPTDSLNKAAVFDLLNWVLTPEPQAIIVNKLNGYPGLDWKYMANDVQQKYADIAKSYSFNFSAKFGNDANQLWYEKVAGAPAPKS